MSFSISLPSPLTRVDDQEVLTLLIVNYTNVLDQCYKTKVPYIRVFEDDIIFTNGWLAKTLRGLYNIEN
ncbi:hypothetical protein GCM10025794_24120 [Massilia kyonggiensis]